MKEKPVDMLPPLRQLRANGVMSVNTADNNLDEDLRWRMEVQEQTFKTQHEALKNIRQILAQFLVNWNIKDTGSNRDQEEYNNDEHPNTQKSKESSSVDAEVIKVIQAQIVGHLKGGE